LDHTISSASSATIDQPVVASKQRPDNASIDDSVRDAIERVTIVKGQIEIRLSEAVASDEQDRVVTMRHALFGEGDGDLVRLEDEQHLVVLQRQIVRDRTLFSPGEGIVEVVVLGMTVALPTQGPRHKAGISR
jgi:hypothetical protein